MAISDPEHATATELLASLAKREVSSVELTRAAIARIERHDPMLNAICVRDFERAMAAARATDAIRARGETRPLLGIPMTVKESFNVAGLPTTWGIPAFKDFMPQEDALAVTRVKAAGAVLLGKTNVPLGLGDIQTYNSIYGTTNNPWDLGRTPGGSSGGSAAALAAGFGALSIGSDLAGSLRVPAQCCGVYAHKPTHGLLPMRGQTPPPGPPLPTERDLAVIGPMARSAADLSLMLDLLAVPDELDRGIAHRLALPASRHEHLANFRILVVDAHPSIYTSGSARCALATLASDLERAGTRVARHSPLLPDLAESARLFMRLFMVGVGASLPPAMYEAMRAVVARLDADDLSLPAERMRGMVMSHRDWLVTDGARAQHCQHWRALFTAFDVVLCPVMQSPAFVQNQSPDSWSRTVTIDGEAHDYGDQLIWSGLATVPGLPATVLPVARSEEGLPIGVQIIGPLYEDRTPLRFAELVEQAFGGFTPPPGW